MIESVDSINPLARVHYSVVQEIEPMTVYQDNYRKGELNKMDIKIISNNSDIKLEFVFEIKQTDNQKFNPTKDNKIHITYENSDEDKYWYFL